MPERIRVLVVDDSPVARMIIRRILEEAGVDVVGGAKNGAEALRMARELRPDVITLDVEMPVMDGLSALARLVEGPWKVIMVSSHTTRGAEVTVRALGMGAVDFVTKPQNSREMEALAPSLVSKIKLAHLARLPSKAEAPARFPGVAGVAAVAIGASTGGPRVILELLGQLKKLPWPVAVAQHMLEGFTGAFAKHLEESTGHPTVEVVEPTPFLPGRVHVASGGRNMVAVRVGKDVYLRPDYTPTSYRPSVDLLFGSLAKIYGKGLLTVVLTGMGNDGLMGAREAVQRGGVVVAQSEESSAIWGMPGAVVREGLASAVLPPEGIVRMLKEAAE